MKALVLEKAGKISYRDIYMEESVGPDDVRIKIRSVGICGSDVHYYRFGRIGNYVVTKPMVLGHEASGTVIDVGSNVKDLKPGDRVCMEPGIPETNSKAVMLGMYNLDPAVRFWATPPIHGCLRETVVHPAQFVFKLPESVSYNEGAMAEPLSVGLQAVKKADVKPGDTALVTGCGTIGLVTAMSALTNGCSRVIITDVIQEKLDIASKYGITSVNITRQDIVDVVNDLTDGWGVDIIFEASGNESAIKNIFDPLCPGGTVVFIGMPVHPVPMDIVAAQSKEAVIKTILRYAHIYPRALSLMESGKIDVKPLITDTYNFEDGVAAFEYATNPKPSSVKIMIEMD